MVLERISQSYYNCSTASWQVVQEKVLQHRKELNLVKVTYSSQEISSKRTFRLMLGKQKHILLRDKIFCKKQKEKINLVSSLETRVAMTSSINLDSTRIRRSLRRIYTKSAVEMEQETITTTILMMISKKTSRLSSKRKCRSMTEVEINQLQ